MNVDFSSFIHQQPFSLRLSPLRSFWRRAVVVDAISITGSPTLVKLLARKSPKILLHRLSTITQWTICRLGQSPTYSLGLMRRRSDRSNRCTAFLVHFLDFFYRHRFKSVIVLNTLFVEVFNNKPSVRLGLHVLFFAQKRLVSANKRISCVIFLEQLNLHGVRRKTESVLALGHNKTTISLLYFVL